MRTAAHCFMSLAIVLLAASAGFGQDEKPDARLSQHVTTDLVSVRLHTVLEQLADQTGIRLNCGRNKDDWQVRDIPVTVCVKDVPLGTVLKALADATHLVLTSEKTDNGRSYRIWRDRKLTLELTDYVDKRKAWADDTARWQWDAMCKFKDVPSSAIDSVKNDYDKKVLRDPQHKQLSEILSLLGTETRDRAFNGERIRITEQGATGRLKTLLDQYLQSGWQSAYSNYLQYRQDGSPDWVPPTQEEYQKCSLVIQSQEPSGNNPRWIDVHAEGPVSMNSSDLAISYTLEKNLKDFGVPKHPDRPEPPGGKAAPLTGDPWQKKISIELPKGKDPITYGTALLAAARAAGYTVIAEDFHSHSRGTDYKILYKADTTLAAVFGYHLLSWTVDEKNKMLVGSERDWGTAHLNLVPGQVIDNIKAKLNGSGAELEDVTPIAYWTNEQMNEWIPNDRDVYELGYPSFPDSDKPIWAFYDSLSPALKAQAKSEQGLKIENADVAALCAAFSERNRKLTPQYDTTDEFGSPVAKSWEIPVDPIMVANTVMFIKATDQFGRPFDPQAKISDESKTDPNAILRFHIYHMVLAWPNPTGPGNMSTYAPGMFPKYSQRRQQQLTAPKPAAAPARTGG